MKKLITLLSVPVVLAVAWAGSSWYIGRQAQTTLQQFIDQQNQQGSTGGVHYELVSYEKSALGAKAITKLVFEMPPLKEMVGEVQFINEVKNGPIFLDGLGVARIHTTLDMDALPTDTRQKLTTAFEGKPPFEANTVLGFGGSNHYDVAVNPAKWTADGTSATLAGAHLQGSATQDMKGEFDMTVDKVEVKEASSQFVMPSMTAKGDIKDVIAGQALGEFEITAPQVSVLAEGTTEPFVFDAKLTSDSDIKDNELAANVVVTLDNMKGIKDALTKAQYSFDVKGLNADGLKEIGAMQTEMQNAVDQIDWNAEALDTPEGQRKQQELMDKVNQSSEKMLGILFSNVLKTDKSQLHVNVVAENAKGKGNADLNLVYAGTTPPDTNQLLTYSALDWLKMMKGKLLVNLDKGILPAGTEMMLLPAVEQGFLVQNGEKYNSELTLAGDSVTLNGKPVPLDGLAQLVAPGAGMSAGAAGMGAGGADPADMGIPDDLMQKIQQEGLTPEVMQLLEESDDVQNVYTNLKISDEVLAAMEEE